jgi:hypothetical protein
VLGLLLKRAWLLTPYDFDLDRGYRITRKSVKKKLYFAAKIFPANKDKKDMSLW